MVAPAGNPGTGGLQHVIVTGASRGLGRSIARALAGPGTRLHLVARSDLGPAATDVEAQGAEVRTHRFDLARVEALEDLVATIFDDIPLQEAAGVTLVLNAGVTEPLGLLGTLEAEATTTNLTVNLVAPTILVNAFVRRTAALDAPRCIVAVTSGAAQHAMPGGSAYASSKAGLDHLLRNLATEQAGAANPVRCLGYSPGMTDTAMQAAIRSTGEAAFPGKSRFVAAFEEGRLNDPDEVARDLAAVLATGSFEDGSVVRFPASETPRTPDNPKT